MYCVYYIGPVSGKVNFRSVGFWQWCIIFWNSLFFFLS